MFHVVPATLSPARQGSRVVSQAVPSWTSGAPFASANNTEGVAPYILPLHALPDFAVCIDTIGRTCVGIQSEELVP